MHTVHVQWKELGEANFASTMDGTVVQVNYQTAMECVYRLHDAAITVAINEGFWVQEVKMSIKGLAAGFSITWKLSMRPVQSVDVSQMV